MTHTVVHYNSVTKRFHVEEAEKGVIWTTDPDTAQRLALGYAAHAFPAEVVLASTLEVENLNGYGALVLVDKKPEDQ